MSVITENQLKKSVSQAIKQVLVDSKYTDEPITFGQAVVTHHFLTQVQQQELKQQQIQQQHMINPYLPLHQQSSQQVQNHHNEPILQSQHINMLNQSISSHINDNKVHHSQVVQFDLLQQQQPEFKAHFGRKKIKFEEEAKNIKDVFQWDDGQTESFRKTKMQELQRSPSRWKTENRDTYRYFVDSPKKKDPNDNSNKVEGGRIAQQNQNQIGGTGGVHPNQQYNQSSQGRLADEYGHYNIEDDDNKNHTKSVRIVNQGDGENGDPNLSSKNDKNKKQKNPKRSASAQKSKQKNMDGRIANLNSTTRWLPDSAFTTYFGKPAFHLYGKGNTNPAVGGNVYGQYMLTHNVNPESGEHLPKYQQTYDTALNKGLSKNNGVRVPNLPRKVRDDIRLTPNQIEEQKHRNPIMPKDRGSKELQRAKSIKIAKPDLQKTKYFNSNHTTQENSMEQGIHQQQIQGKTINNQPKSILGQIKPQDQIQIDQIYDQDRFDGKQLLGLQEVSNQQRIDLQANNPDLMIQEGQDIGDADYQAQNANNNQLLIVQNQSQNSAIQGNQYIPMCIIPTNTAAQKNELNPRNYQQLPSCWTQRIRPAGKLTYKSESLYDVVVSKPFTNPHQDTI
ncbi:UNKNOWN [Stylonychia lemnae]|uniref:Uncharacterized protein n=1 Tax=Stylonychia lemnae TaxID=5949 RepID=A0A078A856_STYLE|nr:UNKNOWN [Stylonychia lemnae]|eukprot:CDW78051.1 UNKNOWN [Stylonychia lemnae]